MRLRTTMVGSYPGRGLSPAEALTRAVHDQVEAGIDLLSDGQVRGDMISAFLDRIPGCMRRPDGRWAVTGRLGTPAGPITVADWQMASSLAAGRPVKAILTGPTTLACAVTLEPGTPYNKPGSPDLVADFAAILKNEADVLVRAGAVVVQVDEPFFAIQADVVGGLSALARVTAGVSEPWLHCCGDLRPVWPLLRQAPVAVLQIEGTRPDRLPPLHEGMAPVLGLGVVDSATDAIEPLAAVLERAEQAAALGAHWLSPDCGLRLRSREAARAKLGALVQAAVHKG